MDITIHPCKLQGKLTVIPSKSQAHRLLICAAFSDRETVLNCPETNQDIEATARCLCALGSEIQRTETGYMVKPVKRVPEKAVLDCGESGSTLRFMLPVVCALGVEVTIQMSGRLPYRPLSPMWEELERMGCTLSRPTENTIHTHGKLKPGKYSIAGNVSSQYITGLLFALSLLDADSQIDVTGKLESRPYVEMTLKALERFGVPVDRFHVRGSVPFSSPGYVDVEGDWSNGAFFLVAGALGHEVTVENLDADSPQGDRAVANIIKFKQEVPVISAADIPDLVPILAVYFASKDGAVFTDIGRLRLKESDRVESVKKMLNALGIQVQAEKDKMQVFGGHFTQGVIDACNDHRIAMTAAIAASIASGPVTILGAECVAKSYPTFWQEFQKLGGKYEQYLR